MTCTQLEDLADHADPDADMALLKSAVIATGIVQVNFAIGDKRAGLEQQLKHRNGGYGIEVQSWTTLPAGSGLGGSSILASALLIGIVRACGQGTHATVHDE